MENIIDRQQTDCITNIKKELSKKVSFVIFAWAIGIILMAIGWIFTSINTAMTRNEENKDKVSTLEGDVKSINANVIWIKESLTRIENKEKKQ